MSIVQPIILTFKPALSEAQLKQGNSFQIPDGTNPQAGMNFIEYVISRKNPVAGKRILKEGLEKTGFTGIETSAKNLLKISTSDKSILQKLDKYFFYKPGTTEKVIARLAMLEHYLSNGNDNLDEQGVYTSWFGFLGR